MSNTQRINLGSSRNIKTTLMKTADDLKTHMNQQKLMDTMHLQMLRPSVNQVRMSTTKQNVRTHRVFNQQLTTTSGDHLSYHQLTTHPSK